MQVKRGEVSPAVCRSSVASVRLWFVLERQSSTDASVTVSIRLFSSSPGLSSLSLFISFPPTHSSSVSSIHPPTHSLPLSTSRPPFQFFLVSFSPLFLFSIHHEYICCMYIHGMKRRDEMKWDKMRLNEIRRWDETSQNETIGAETRWHESSFKVKQTGKWLWLILLQLSAVC